MERTYIPHKMPELQQRAPVHNSPATRAGRAQMEYRRERPRERTTGSRPKRKKTGVRLLICITILAFTLFCKTAFSDGYKKLSTEVMRILCGSVDYEEAISCIGDAVKGEVKVSEALERAYTAAFGLKEEDEAIYTSEPDSAENRAEEDKAQAPESEEERTAKAAPQAFTYWGAADDSVDENYKTAVVDAFTDSMGEYADKSPPDNVTYDFIDLEFEYICPVDGAVSSSFGYRLHPNDGALRFHYGTDIAADKGTDIVAFADGKVIAVGDSASYGMYILIEHEDGVRTQYSHCSEIYAESGDKVIKGETIAAVGDTGNATGPCLHFEITEDGTYLNPEYYVSWT